MPLNHLPPSNIRTGVTKETLKASFKTSKKKPPTRKSSSPEYFDRSAPRSAPNRGPKGDPDPHSKEAAEDRYFAKMDMYSEEWKGLDQVHGHDNIKTFFRNYAEGSGWIPSDLKESQLVRPTCVCFSSFESEFRLQLSSKAVFFF